MLGSVIVALLPVLASSWQDTPPTEPPPPDQQLMQPAAPVPAGNPFMGAFSVGEPIRIAATPKIDGVIEPDEWDPLLHHEGLTSYLQWEPGLVYFAAQVPDRREVVLSFDLNGDGWLVGRDNLQLRIKPADGRVEVRSVLLDATDRQGPKWAPPPLLEDAVRAEGKLADNGWSLELKLLSLGITDVKVGSQMGFRCDAVEATTEVPEPFWPRPTALLSFQLEKAVGLPPGMSWKPHYKVRSIPPGDTMRIGLEFRDPAAPNFGRIAMRVEGMGAREATIVEQPFPGFDGKGRARVDYETPIAADASFGYRVMQAKLMGPSGEEAIVRSSFMIADLVTFDVNLPRNLTSKDDAQIVRGNVVLRSQSLNRLDGKFTLKVPEGWSVAKGNDTGFTIYHSRGSYKVNLELIAPAGARGLFPLRFHAAIGDKQVEQAILLPIR